MNKLLIYYYCGVLLLFILSIYTYYINPIRYSKASSVLYISYNTLYWYLHFIILVLLSVFSLFLEKIRPEMPSFWAAIPLLFGVFTLNLLHDTPVEEDGTFNHPPKHLVLNKFSLLKRLIFVLLLLIAFVVVYTYYKKYQNHIIPLLVCIILYVYIIHKQNKYSRIKYNLPQTWSN